MVSNPQGTVSLATLDHTFALGPSCQLSSTWLQAYEQGQILAEGAMAISLMQKVIGVLWPWLLCWWKFMTLQMDGLLVIDVSFWTN